MYKRQHAQHAHQAAVFVVRQIDRTAYLDLILDAVALEVVDHIERGEDAAAL